ncbi:MAG: DNA integrity scanning protein DisA nucleotide-binding domain protein [Thermodesulfobacteriota bacterium]
MSDPIIGNISIYHISEGLREALSHFSGPSRVAIIYAAEENDAVRMYDPQELLRGHELKLKEIYLESNAWRETSTPVRTLDRFRQPIIETGLPLAGLISMGGRSHSMFYQMWFTEHHPEMCSTGPTERWLVRAAWLLSQDIARDNADYTGESSYVIREYAPHAVRDYLVNELNRRIGMDIQLRIYPILDAVLGISRTMEEGLWPRGELVVMEPRTVSFLKFLARFPSTEQPKLKNFKHVRKLLQAVENSDRKLISDGDSIVGISGKELPSVRLVADFRGGHGFLKLNNDPICSFSDGNFHSFTRRAKMVQLEEFLLEADFDPPSLAHDLFQIIADIVHHAEAQKFGCTLVIDINRQPIEIAGQHLEVPLDLRDPVVFSLTTSLAKLDGALHISSDLKLHGFACILDGHALKTEDRSRGARYNSALRFTAEHDHILVVVVSADRPVSVIQEGREFTLINEWRATPARLTSPPLLEEWLRG